MSEKDMLAVFVAKRTPFGTSALSTRPRNAQTADLTDHAGHMSSSGRCPRGAGGVHRFQFRRQPDALCGRRPPAGL